MKLYSTRDVEQLALSKVKFLRITLPPPLPLVFPPGSYHERLGPNYEPVKKRDYIPPADASPDDPAPEEIHWEGELIKVNVIEADGLLLYLVNTL